MRDLLLALLMFQVSLAAFELGSIKRRLTRIADALEKSPAGDRSR